MFPFLFLRLFLYICEFYKKFEYKENIEKTTKWNGQR